MTTEPNLDLSRESILAHCKGDVRNLPRLMVHENAWWPSGVVRTDNQKRIHLCRRDLVEIVAREIPVRPGLWLGPTVQEFLIDLRPDQLQGSADSRHESRVTDFRKLVRADAAGRIPGEEDYADASRLAAPAAVQPGAATQPKARARSGGEGEAGSG